MDVPELCWQTYTFAELDAHRLYAIMMLRQEVFVVEQRCWYLDADGKDRQALHLCGWDDGKRLLAYARLFDRGHAYPDHASIGRVVMSPSLRGRGVGYVLMQRAVDKLYARYGRQPIKLSAQAHLQAFYGKLGFEGVGEVYDEDGIPHRAMVKV